MLFLLSELEQVLFSRPSMSLVKELLQSTQVQSVTMGTGERLERGPC
jgi:hypothetical protein